MCNVQHFNFITPYHRNIFIYYRTFGACFNIPWSTIHSFKITFNRLNSALIQTLLIYLFEIESVLSYCVWHYFMAPLSDLLGCKKYL